ncbi:MAG: alpha/beta fold hydrolase [Ilumatobacteraceae bacterium]
MTTRPGATVSGGGPDATAADERPVVVDASTGQLLAVVTSPTAPAIGIAAVLLRGAGWRPSSGPRRTQVRTARRLAAHGVHGVRFSYHGIAESTGEHDEIVRLDQPYTEDLGAVVAWCQRARLRPLLIGNCFGARTALAYAAAPDHFVAGVVMLVPPMHDFEVARRLDRRPVETLAKRVTPRRALAVMRDPTRRRALGRTLRALADVGRRRVRRRGADDPVWLSRTLCRQLDDVVRRSVPVLVVYGDDDNYGRDFETARRGTLGVVVDRAGAALQVRTVPGRIHGQTSVETQQATLDAVEDWVERTFGTPGSPA